ncbi:MAG: FkbM family methyltransferase [Phormidesmis sp.]
MNVFPKSLRLPLEYESRKFKNTIENEILILENLIPKSGRAIDIGANRGLYTYKLSQICDYVESFEPQPACADIIYAYTRRFRQNVTVHNCALSNFKGTSNLKIPVIQGRMRRSQATGLASLNDLAQACDELSVPVCRLDDYNFSDVVFIKIDVEGHEQKVLEGACETLMREKPVLLVEIEQRHLGEIPMTTVFDDILSLGYTGQFLINTEMKDIREFSYEVHQRPFLSQIMASAESGVYVNNFVFTPKV